MSRLRVPQHDPHARSRWSLAALAAFALLAAGFLVWPGSLDSAAVNKLPSPIVTVIPGDGSVTVQWQHLIPEHVSSSFLLYRDRLGGSLAGGWEVEVAARGSDTITGLTNGHTYYIIVTANVSIGTDSGYVNADWQEVPVTVGSPQAPVVSAAPLNTDVDLDVTWSEPEDNGASISGYEVQYKRSDSETWSEENVLFPTGHTRRAWISGLDAGKPYDVRARATNARGTGPWSAIATGTPVVPPPPQYAGSTTVDFSAAAYSATEGDAITIELRLGQAQPEPVRVQLRPAHGDTAEWWSDYSLGPCLPGEETCEFGVGMLDAEFAVGETSYRYEIDTVNDQRVESDETFTLSMVALSRNVGLGDTSQAVLTIKNNDSAGVTLGAERVGVNEEASGTYTVKLTSQPYAWVRVYAESANGCKVAGGYVELGPNNWNQDQNVMRLYARHDYDAADEEVTISHRVEASSRDAAYGSVTVKPLTVSVTDQHSPSVIVETTSLSPTVGATAGYRVYLNADPSPIYGAEPDGCYDYTESRTVTITAISSDANVATVSPASVTFTADDYDPKSFTVNAVSSGDATITHSVSGSDPDYTDGTIMIKKVAVSVPAAQQAVAPVEQEGMHQHATPLQVEASRPGPVLELELTARADRLTASWRPPESGDPPTSYIAHINPVGGGKGKTRTPNASKTSVTFGKLEAGQSYKIWVRAKNQAGKGPRTWAVITLPQSPAK